MLQSIKFKFGSAKDSEALEVIVRPSITIFVGPNNSGKSQALRELNNFFLNGSNPAGLVIDEVTFAPFTEVQAREELDRVSTAPVAGETLSQDYLYIETINGRSQVSPKAFIA
ncbi:ATPase, partial [Neisseria gonorrhoeae]|uniref:ATP-binding protein n=1 Tax=Neisseria gonorrhoeae TaxID=485 RepID=UPI000D4AF62D